MGSVVKLTFADGIIGRTQFEADNVSDAEIQEAISTTLFSHGSVTDWQRSTLVELAPLMAAQAPPPPEPPRDPIAELDALTAKLKAAKSFDDLAVAIDAAEAVVVKP